MSLATEDRIRTAVRRFAETGHGDVRKLRGRRDEWALRVGSMRVLYGIIGDILRVRGVRDRREAYRQDIPMRPG